MPSGGRKTQFQVPWCFSLSFDASFHRWGTWLGALPILNGSASCQPCCWSTLMFVPHGQVLQWFLRFQRRGLPGLLGTRSALTLPCLGSSLSGALWRPHWPARITVYWLLLGPMSYALAPCQDFDPSRGAGLSEGGLVEAADRHPAAR